MPSNQFIPSVQAPDTLNSPLFFIVCGEQLLVPDNFQTQPETLWQQPEFTTAPQITESHYLGNWQGRDCVALLWSDCDKLPEGTCLVSLYQLLLVLGSDLLNIAGMALQILAWNRQHGFCGQCGRPTEPLAEVNERARYCMACKLHFYPRLAPCIIVLVYRQEQLLLAHGNKHPEGMYSTLAGFVEPGETIEQAVHREIDEETGIRVKSPEYFNSQPWPFPNQLMLGFFAEYQSGDIKPDLDEITDAGWWHYSQLPEVPGQFSIAGRLIATMVARLANK